MTSFALDIAKFAEKAKAAQSQIVRAISTEILTRIVLRTPVGNPSLWKGKPPAGYVGGRARANWTVSLGSYSGTTLELVDKDGRTTIARGMNSLSSWQPGESIYIMNSLPYIRPLEYEGHSKQAPVGMVRITVAEFQTIVDNAVKGLQQ